MGRIKRMKKDYLPETIEHLGYTFKPIIGIGTTDAEKFAREKQAEGKRIILLSILSKNLRGKTDLHGKPYTPTKWVFVAEQS